MPTTDVTGAATYDAAKRLLAASSFDLLISDVRLRGFNGLTLVMKCRADYPDMAVIIISGYDEPLIDLEASRYQAHVRRQADPARGLPRHGRTLPRQRPARAPLAAQARGRRLPGDGSRQPAAVVDVSYGGLRLEVPSGTDLT